MTSAPVILASLERMGLKRPGIPAALTPLAGGVSSDIVRVDLPGGPVCVKQALPRLKVQQLWTAPVERNRAEHDWLALVGRILPDAVPRLLGEDPAAGLFAMAFLDPATYPVWKAELMSGHVDLAFAGRVGECLAAIHAATAGDAAVAARFAHDATFHAIRLEPYLLATARRHPDLAGALEGLAQRTAATRLALVHGDVSPKNILAGPKGPVLLDAECAWYGDPAFDLAFCLNHLLLKCLWRPDLRRLYLEAYAALRDRYLAGVGWEPPAVLEDRAATLLPGLFLARVDGKSPVEYVEREADRQRVRRVAGALLRRPPARLAAVAAAWEAELSA